MNSGNNRVRQPGKIFLDDEVDNGNIDCDSCPPGEYEDAMETQILKMLG